MTLFEAAIELVLLLISLGSFQSFLGVFGLVGDGVSIHDTHVMSTVWAIVIANLLFTYLQVSE